MPFRSLWCSKMDDHFDIRLCWYLVIKANIDMIIHIWASKWSKGRHGNILSSRSSIILKWCGPKSVSKHQYQLKKCQRKVTMPFRSLWCRNIDTIVDICASKRSKGHGNVSLMLILEVMLFKLISNIIYVRWVARSFSSGLSEEKQRKKSHVTKQQAFTNLAC